MAAPDAPGGGLRALSSVLSFLVPGLGQMVQGRRRAAAVFFFGALAIYTAVIGIAMFVTPVVTPRWVLAVGIGWHLVAGTEALFHLRSSAAPPGR